MESEKRSTDADIIHTGVDRLVSFLEGKDKVYLLDVAKALAVKPETVQAWTDFLVEENIIGIEYKFTKPYIYLNHGDVNRAKVTSEADYSWETFHRTFLDRAHDKGIGDMETAALWKSHVLTLVEQRRRLFIDEARKRGLADPDHLWETYKLELLMKI